MELTGFGIALGLACLAALIQPIWHLKLVLVTGAFGAASPLIITGLGLPPGVPPAVLFLGFVTLQYLLGVHYPAERQAWRLLEPYLLTAAYALLTALLVPRLFAGAFTVWPQKPTPPYDIPIPLAPGAGNVTQSLYMLIEAALLTGAALFLTRTGIDHTRILRAYLGTGYLVVVICAWQAANKVAGVWYPSAFLYSNPGWLIYTGQTLGFVPRINGPFSEPAALAFYLSGTIFSCTWILLRGHRSRLAAFLLPLAVAALMLSTSTTGFAVLGIGAVLLTVHALTVAPKRVRLRILLAALPAALLFIGIGYAISTLSARIEESIAMVFRQTLNKADGDSFQIRTGLDIDSLALIFPSYGLGAGWGSVRASSLLPNLLANLGLIGTATLAWFGIRLSAAVMQARRAAPSVRHLLAIDGLSAAIVGQVAAAMVSAPSIHALDFYVLLSALIACVARIEYDRARAQSRPQVAHFARNAEGHA